MKNVCLFPHSHTHARARTHTHTPLSSAVKLIERLLVSMTTAVGTIMWWNVIKGAHCTARLSHATNNLVWMCPFLILWSYRHNLFSLLSPVPAPENKARVIPQLRAAWNGEVCLLLCILLVIIVSMALVSMVLPNVVQERHIMKVTQRVSVLSTRPMLPSGNHQDKKSRIMLLTGNVFWYSNSFIFSTDCIHI